MSNNLIFLDIETTGLNPEKDEILEVVMVAYDPTTRKVVDTFKQVLPFVLGQSNDLSSVVTQMHLRNGLFEECAELRAEIREKQADELDFWWHIEDLMVEFIKTHGPYSPMCGNTVSFDRSFLKKKMPRVEKEFSYRHLDVSSLNIVADRFNTGLQRVNPLVSRHRALPDCLDSIVQLEGYLDQFGPAGVL